MSTTASEVPAGTRSGPGARTVLQSVWIFVLLNYLYCDVATLMNGEDLRGFLAGEVGGMQITAGFLLAAGILMEIPMAMVLISRLAPYRFARTANIAAGALMTVVQVGTLFGSAPTPFYLFFSVIEISATAFVAGYAWRRRAERG